MDPEAPKTIRYEVEPPLAIITLNRPAKRNALNPQLIAEITNAFTAAAVDPWCRVVLLRAEGRAFCAGLDLESLRDISQLSPEENLEDSRRLATMLRNIYALPKPVIAIVNGPAVAGGCGLATVCDFTLATPAAKFGYTEVRIGFIAAIVSVFLTRLIGEKGARDLLLSGRLIDAAEAARLGLVNEVVEAERIEDTARRLALELAKNSPAALAVAKQSFVALHGKEFDAELDHACRMNAEARSSPECIEGIRAFLEKRPPNWQKPS